MHLNFRWRGLGAGANPPTPGKLLGGWHGGGGIFHFQLPALPNPSSKNGPPAALLTLPEGMVWECHVECQSPMEYYHGMRSSKAMKQRDQFPMSNCLSVQQAIKLGFGSGRSQIKIPSNSQAKQTGSSHNMDENCHF